MSQVHSVSPEAAQWLKRQAAAGRASARVCVAARLVDPVAAIGFAFALAGLVLAAEQGVVAMAPWFGLAIGSVVARAGAATMVAFWGATRARQVKHQVRRQVARGALGRRRAAARDAGAAAHRMIDDVEALDGYFARFLPERSTVAIAPTIVLAAVATASPVAAIILILASIALIAALALAGSAAATESRRQLAALERLSSLFLDRLRALPLILAFEAQEGTVSRFAAAATELERRTASVLRVAFISSAALEFFAALSVALVAVYAGFALLGLLPFPAPEHIDLPRALFVLALAPEFYAPFRRLAAAYHDKQLGEAAAGRLVEPDPPALPARVPCTSPPQIVFDAVRLDLGRRALMLDFTAPAGRLTVLAGASGAGKTTALEVLAGLAKPSSGVVRVDGRPLDQGMPAIAWAGQQTFLSPGTIAENLRLAAPRAPDAALVAMVEALGLADLIEARGGLDAPLDERGSGLSGGERRRLGLARALLAEANLLLFDEPTADLDLAAETRALDAIIRFASGRTIIMASHARQAAARADHVAVIL